MFFPDDLWYDKNHFWARMEGDTVVMGTTDFAQKLAGDIGYVELPEEGHKVTSRANRLGRLSPGNGSVGSMRYFPVK